MSHSISLSAFFRASISSQGKIFVNGFHLMTVNHSDLDSVDIDFFLGWGIRDVITIAKNDSEIG